ncbi:8-oxoguanine DNA glycosylase OGG fold protein [Arthrobacter ramosus]|uniref:Uncharacterized protein n=1 Tax=Arthrobacter ramosus TaxID=1672 RepID=A0ABV5XWU6_ARTRM|nr:hypothetical protein [Arthrobacter ramosus]
MSNPAAPAPLIEWLRPRTREETIFSHKVLVNLDWWNRQPELAGQPLVGTLEDKSVTTEGKAWSSRGDLFELAAGPGTSDTLPLLWAAVAWGTGTRHRLNLKRIDAVYQDRPRAEGILRSAYIAAAKSARDGYTSMRGTRNTNGFKFLGPAFFSKVLYFAGAGNPGHPCLIVDDRVLATLRAWAGPEDKRFNYRYGYPVSTYESAVDLMQEWANTAADNLGREVAADEVERWAFEVSGRK